MYQTNSKIVYMDNMLATRIDERVFDAMKPYYFEYYGRMTSEVGHSMGVKLLEDVTKARKIIANSINASPNEVIFTSGSTEANNIAIKGLALANKKKEKNVIITTKIARSCMIQSSKFMSEYFGYTHVYVKVDREGFIDVHDLEDKLSKNNVLLVSILLANHEIGTIQDIKQISRLVHDYGAYLHVDASFAFLKMPIDVRALDIDLLTLESANIHGPKGAGALYIKDGIDIRSPLSGDAAEFGLRPGLQDIPAIIGFAKAVEVWDWTKNNRIRKMRDALMVELLSIENTELNGPKGDKRVINNVNISFKGVEGEAITLLLNMKGIIVNTGSACFSPVLEPSRVILALGKQHEDAHGSIIFTLSKYNTEDEIPYVVEVVKESVTKLRALSPVA